MTSYPRDQSGIESSQHLDAAHYVPRYLTLSIIIKSTVYYLPLLQTAHVHIYRLQYSLSGLVLPQ